jgi:porin
VYGGQNVFLYQVFLQMQMLEDNKLLFKVGRFGASDDFNTSPIYGLYMNNGIDGDIRNVLFDTQFSAYPFATWAGRVRVDPTPHINAEFGAFQTSTRTFDSSLQHGLDWSIQPGDGTFLIGQVGWTPVFSKPDASHNNAVDTSAPAIDTPANRSEYPGHYWFGASYSRWQYPQFGTSVKADDSYGFYAMPTRWFISTSPEPIRVW